MEAMRDIFKTLIEAKLAAAPASAAKTDLVEELADNLHCRYEDMVAGGVSPETALVQSMDALGDANELLDYLKGAETERTAEKKDSSFSGDLEDVLRNVKDVTKEVLGQAKNAVSDVDWAGLMNSAAESTKGAAHKAKSSLKNMVKLARENGGVWIGRSGDKTVHVRVDEDGKTAVDIVADGAEEPEVSVEVEETDEAVERDDNWKLGVTLKNNEETDEGEVLYGLGYDKKKGGFYWQWGRESAPEKTPVDGPVESTTLRGIDVQLTNGEVVLNMTREPEDDVLVGGENVGSLDITVSTGGVLMIRPRWSPSGRFFSVASCDDSDVRLELELPRRDWDFLRLSSVCGDIEAEGDHRVENLTLKSTSGDIRGTFPACGCLDFQSVSGDVNWSGNAATVRGSTVSGDIRMEGDLGQVHVKSVSGDIRAAGAASAFQCSTTSGDIDLTTDRLPERIAVSTRSGDTTVGIPAGGSFLVRYELAAGDFRTDFFRDYDEHRGTLTCGEAGGAQFTFQSSSGDVRLEQY